MTSRLAALAALFASLLGLPASASADVIFGPIPKFEAHHRADQYAPFVLTMTRRAKSSRVLESRLVLPRPLLEKLLRGARHGKKRVTQTRVGWRRRGRLREATYSASQLEVTVTQSVGKPVLYLPNNRQLQTFCRRGAYAKRPRDRVYNGSIAKLPVWVSVEAANTQPRLDIPRRTLEYLLRQKGNKPAGKKRASAAGTALPSSAPRGGGGAGAQGGSTVVAGLALALSIALFGVIAARRRRRGGKLGYATYAVAAACLVGAALLAFAAWRGQSAAAYGGSYAKVVMPAQGTTIRYDADDRSQVCTASPYPMLGKKNRRTKAPRSK
ncbi:MAG: hypothetical protein KC503_36405 [Myxococcales bacterium]|nr:hypothetical protein [Myxococcales bacterium]